MNNFCFTKDHQGNLTATIHGNAVERLGYDAWGRRRNPVGFGYENVSHTFDRGYTLHEHYDDFGLINMNGRLYDPVLGRMLSPDIAIQDEYNAQAYNRYSYCFNNPLRFTDPSGYVVEDDWYLDKNGRIIWDDNVTGVANTPEGGVYIGSNDQDILRYYGLHERYENKRLTRWGISLNGVTMEYDHNGNLYPNQSPWIIPTIPVDKIEGNLTVSAKVSFNTDEVSGTNKMGRAFEGFVFQFSLSQSARSLIFEGYAGVYYNDKMEESHLEPRNETSVGKTGSQYTNAQVIISAENIQTKDSFIEAQIRAGSVNRYLFISPRPVKMKWNLTMPRPASTPNRYTFKYYLFYEK